MGKDRHEKSAQARRRQVSNMSFAAPLALALGSLAIPLILLYMLRLRRREQPISSTLLWQELTRDRAANAPWQKLKRNIFLLLQLLILAALVLALARPYVLSADPITGHVFVLLDASASMTATDGGNGGSRFDEAVEKIDQMLNELGGDDRLTLIIVSDSPVVAATATNDRGLLSNALLAAKPKLTSADWHAAFSLVNGSLQGVRQSRIIIVSDGGLPDDLPPLAGDPVFIPVGAASENLAISVIGNRELAGQSELLVGVANNGPAEQSALLSIYLDEQLYDSRRIDIAAGEEASLTWVVPTTTGVVEARLSPADGGGDFLPADNRAWSLVGSSVNTTVKLVTDGNQFIERFFSIIPGYEVTRASADDLQSADHEERFDLYIFDGVAIPSTLPDGNVLIFDPQPAEESSQANPSIEVSDIFTNTQMTSMVDDPRLADVLWRDVNIAQARQVHAPGLTTLIDSEGGPLLLAGEIDGRRVAVFPFDLGASDLPLRIAFPVIMANITEWLHSGSSGATSGNFEPGAVVSLPRHPRAAALQVTLPDGGGWTDSIAGGDGSILFDQTDQTGLYSFLSFDDSGELVQSGQFTVNFFDHRESRIMPNETITLGTNEVLSDDEQTRGSRELWAIVLGVGLLLIALEWWLAYHRGLNQLLSKAR